MAKTSRRIPLPTPFELTIIKIVWSLKTATVRDVYEAITEQRRIAYTTVTRMMKIMERKGLVRRAQSARRAFVYKATHTQERVINAMVHEFVDRVFEGSPQALVACLIDDCSSTPDPDSNPGVPHNPKDG